MKYFLILISFLFLSACSIPADKPQKPLSKEQMAEIIADLAIYSQIHYIEPKINVEKAHLFLLKKYQITVEDLRENYQYYTYAPASLDEIHKKAKKIILEKDPKFKDFLEKKKKKQMQK